MNAEFKELLLAFSAPEVEYVIVGAHALIINKKTAGRLQDLADVERLETLGDERLS